MNNIKFQYTIEHIDYELEMVFVEGTQGKPFLFGDERQKREINIQSFFISKFPLTQAFWKYVMGNEQNPSVRKGNNRPVEGVSWNYITAKDGFLEQIAERVLEQIRNQLPKDAKPNFRLPSESEWEYAARGGKNWRDNFLHSGSDIIDEVAWYQKNSNDQTHDVGQKAPNQLDLYDMNGNVWEWCQDDHDPDINNIPQDGSPLSGRSNDRILRGGCYHNWAIHCTVSKRYEINRDYKDGCIGFRLVLSF